MRPKPIDGDIVMGDKCRHCGDAIENPHDQAGPRICGDCRAISLEDEADDSFFGGFTPGDCD